MTFEDDAHYEALNEVSNILDETRKREISLPLGTIFHLGLTLITTSPKDDVESDKRKLTSSIVSRLEEVIPPELIEEGTEGYTGDLSTVVPILLSSLEVEHIGQAALSLPSGRQIIDALPIDPSDRAELEGFRNRQLGAFLTLVDEYSKIGGGINLETRSAIEQELS